MIETYEAACGVKRKKATPFVKLLHFDGVKYRIMKQGARLGNFSHASSAKIRDVAL